MASTSFASAPTDVQKNWEAAGECAAGNDYLGAVTNLTLVFSNAPRLTAEQNAALEQAWLEIGNRAFRAGEKGDKNAVKAVLQMRASPFGKVKGER